MAPGKQPATPKLVGSESETCSSSGDDIDEDVQLSEVHIDFTDSGNQLMHDQAIHEMTGSSPSNTDKNGDFFRIRRS